MKQKILEQLYKIKRPGAGLLIAYLNDNGYFEAPASAKYHLNCPSGLAKHSWNVFYLLSEKNKLFNLALTEESVIICGLLHDLCKIDAYKLVGPNDYKYTNNFPIGHGEKSVILLQQFITLTEQEMLMIRWHMSNFDLSDMNKQTYYNLIKAKPEVFAMYTADHEASLFLD